jgi:glycosyltransferase involved in cell wall biosynthesis
MDRPLITVITPAYNIEAYLGVAASAVVGQSFGDFEYLIVDDGSTDSTATVAASFAESDKRVRVIKGNHSGSSAARNLGLAEAQGEFIAFCDGDDQWEPTFLERMVAELRRAPAPVGAVFSAFSYIDESGRPWGKTTYAPLGDYDADRMLSGHCPPGNGSCLLIRKSCFDEAGNFDEELHNCVDLDMWLRINLESQTPLFRFIAEPLVQWRVRSGAISSSEVKRVEGLEIMFERYANVLRPNSTTVAYGWPAVLAYYAGCDETARSWHDKVRNADARYWCHSRNGLILAVFARVGPQRGRKLRAIAARAVASVRRARMAVGKD